MDLFLDRLNYTCFASRFATLPIAFQPFAPFQFTLKIAEKLLLFIPVLKRFL